MEDSFLMNNRDKPRRLSTLSTVSVSQESSFLGRLESGDKNTNYSSTDEEDEEKDASWKAQVSFQQDSDLSSPPLIVELIVSFGVFIMGWYLPKILFIPYLLGGIRERQIPYQTIPSTGDVILDLSLSHPYKEQVIINGKAFHFFWYFQGYLLSLILSGMLIFDSGTALHVINFKILRYIDWTLIITSCWIPMLILSCSALIYPLKQYQQKMQVQAAICTVLMSIGLSELTTKMIKAWVGRLRPNFYELCGFDVQTKMCTASAHHVNEGRQSFPSGHSSLAFQGMVLVVLCLVGRIGLFSMTVTNANNNSNKSYTGFKNLLRTKQMQTTFSIIVPLSYGMFVAASRLVDNWHHPSDILAGTMIGVGSASLAYHIFYPGVGSKYSGIPYACLVS